MWAPVAITTASKPYLFWHSALPNTAGISRQLCMQVFRITLLSCHSLCPCSTSKSGYAASDIIFTYTLYLSPPSRSPYFLPRPTLPYLFSHFPSHLIYPSHLHPSLPDTCSSPSFAHPRIMPQSSSSRNPQRSTKRRNSSEVSLLA
jgi:hypothetical protein